VSDDKQSIWKREISFGRKPKEQPAPEPEPEAAAPEPAPADAPVDINAELEAIKAAALAAIVPEPVAETVAAPERAPEPAPAAEPEPVVEEATAELPASVAAPAEDAEPKVPFWKRELGPKRTPKRPKAERAPKERKLKRVKEPKEKKEKQPKPERSGEQVSFWKKEISFGKRPVRKQDGAPREKGGRLSLPFALPRMERKAHAKRGASVPKKLVGIKVGASQIAAARVSNNGSAELVLAVREDLEPGIVVGGELREPEKLAELLREFFRKHNLPRRNVRLGIANNRIGVRSFEIEGIEDPKQLDNAIRFRAQEALPIPIEDAVLDYQILSESKNEAGETVKRVLLVVAYRELVDRYVSAFRKAGIELVGIDLEAFALLRAMAAPRETALEDAAVVVVAIGHDRSTFAVSDGRVCEFTRVLEWGGWSLNIALARALDKSPSEVEQLKRSLDLNATVVPDGWTVEQFEAVRDAARRQIQSFARELVSSLQFYQNQPGSLGIAELVLTGGTAHFPGLADELQRLIGVTVRVGDPLMRVRVGKKAVADDEQVGSLAIAIGLGIED